MHCNPSAQHLFVIPPPAHLPQWATSMQLASSELEPSEPESSELEPSEPESSELESSELEPSEIESSELEPSEPESSELEPSELEPSELELSELTVHEELVACGQLWKQFASSTVSPFSRVRLNVTVTSPEVPGVEAYHVAPLLRVIWMVSSPPILMLAAETPRERPEKIILLYQALPPSRTVAVGDPTSSHSTSSYVIPFTPVLQPVISSKTVS